MTEAITAFFGGSAAPKKADLQELQKQGLEGLSPEDKIHWRSLETGMGEPPAEVVRGAVIAHELDRIESGTSYNERLQTLLRTLKVTAEIPP